MSNNSLHLDELYTNKVNDPMSILLGVGIFLTVNNIIYNVLFIILGSAADLKGYSAQQIGLLGTVYLLGQMVANFSSVFWVRKLNWKMVVGVSTLISVLSLYLSSFANYQMFMILLTITGLASGSALACVMCCISGLKDPGKAYSLGLCLQVVVAGAVIYILQVHVTPNFGYSGLLYTIAGFFAFSLLFLYAMPSTDGRSIPKQAPSEKLEKSKTSKKIKADFSVPSIIALGGIAIYFIGQTGIWGFLERIAVSKNMDNEFIGITLGAVLVLCSLGAVAAIKVGKSIGLLRPMALGMFFFMLSIALWVVSDDKWVYALSALLYASAWNFCLPYQLLAVNQTDKDGRYAAMIPAFQSIGGAAGPAMVGVLIIDGSFNYVYLFAIFTTLLSFVCFWLVTKKHGAEPVEKNMESETTPAAENPSPVSTL